VKEGESVEEEVEEEESAKDRVLERSSSVAWQESEAFS
jgi:hypothetical protein